MVERDDPTSLALLWDGPVAAGESVVLAASALRHALVRRVHSGDAVRLLDGRGRVGHGTVSDVSGTSATVVVARVENVPRPLALELLVPVADRDRMLWAAEKCVEHQVTAWRPVVFARSRSVSPRGEGPRFAEKVRARMASALEQCGGAWMPDLHEEEGVDSALRGVPASYSRLFLDATGAPASDCVPRGPVALAVGPEGGCEPREIESARAAGWITASLGATILRFETAIVSGAAVVRALQLSTRGA